MGPLERDIGPVDFVREAIASIVGFIDPTVEALLQDGMADGIFAIPPTAKRISANLRLARTSFQEIFRVHHPIITPRRRLDIPPRPFTQ